MVIIFRVIWLMFNLLLVCVLAEGFIYFGIVLIFNLFSCIGLNMLPVYISEGNFVQKKRNSRRSLEGASSAFKFLGEFLASF